MAKRLIINADDYGRSTEINSKIIECYRRGDVTDMSIMAVGEAFEEAVSLAKNEGVTKLGAHLTLTGGFKPVIGADEKFPRTYRSFLGRYFTGAIKSGEIRAELKSQILKVKKTGFKITHVDSHHHVHMTPGILKIVVGLMKEEGIGYIRFPLEKMPFLEKLKNPHALARNFLLSSMCRVAKSIIDGAGIKYNDDFRGHAYAPRLSRKRFISAISGLADGLTEFCCHPGDAAEETRALCEKEFKNELKAQSVELVSY